MARNRIVARARVIHHRQIPVIQQLSAVGDCSARGSMSRMSMPPGTRQRLRFVADAVSHHLRGKPGPAPERFQRQVAGAADAAD